MSPPEDFGKIARAVVQRFGRMRVDHPDHENYQVEAVREDGRLEVRKPHWPEGVTMAVPFQNPREARTFAPGMGVRVGFEEGNRQLPFVHSLGRQMSRALTYVAWPCWGFSYGRSHAQSVENTGVSALGATELNIEFPIHWRNLGSTAYAYREDDTGDDPVRYLTTSGGSEVEIAKVWHDILITEEQDGIVGLESAASLAMTGAHPTDGRFTEGQVCVMCREVSDLSLRWETCLATFEVEVEDDGIIIGP